MKIPKPLLEDIKEGKCLLFIGAGFSLNCSAPAELKMPDWSGLSETWANEADIDSKLPPPKIAFSLRAPLWTCSVNRINSSCPSC